MKKIGIIPFIAIIALLGGVVIYMMGGSDDSSNDMAEASQPEMNSDTAIEEVKVTDSPYTLFIDNISSGGPPKDGIPPIDGPTYITVNEAMSRMEDYDKVFVYEGKEDTYLYPQNILVWHEIVNDIIDGDSLSITYCPLTGSTICYEGDIAGSGENLDTTYGTSGKLLNSNLVMYDRATDSYIPQIFGTAITGDLSGTTLETRPIHWSNWSDAIKAFPDAKVLSTETGYIRDYEADPYGTYQPEDNRSYYANDGVMFPLTSTHDGPFSDKKVVVGIKSDDGIVALDPMYVRRENEVTFMVGSTEMMAVWDDALKTARVYHKDTPETSPVYFDVMWFAWYAYYPETEVIQ